MKDDKIVTLYSQNTVEALPYIVQALFLAPGIQICVCSLNSQSSGCTLMHLWVQNFKWILEITWWCDYQACRVLGMDHRLYTATKLLPCYRWRSHLRAKDTDIEYLTKEGFESICPTLELTYLSFSSRLPCSNFKLERKSCLSLLLLPLHIWKRPGK